MLRIALLQLKVQSNKSSNIQNAITHIHQAVENKAQIVILPECFNCPYHIDYFQEYAESMNGNTFNQLKSISKQHQILLIGGSIPELENGKLFNTCFVFENGHYLGKHQKVHLFDINIPNKISFQESKVLHPGQQITTLETSFGKIGIGICYDVRFPELTIKSARQGAFLQCFPGAFNSVTGPLHWDLLMRSRALDSQIFVAACAPALDLKASYHSHGHSMVVDPMGRILNQADVDECIIYADLNRQDMEDARENIPINKQRRFDLYPEIK
eukprot:NODE_1039_length_2500_cov_0.346939.p2 type:complete len:271 gc:universal NODE_1039_length_2500_cov_0.346939:449-1261(+)